ncbi:MAG: hypothetical protein O7F12_05665 [Nitrospirae bacterium]|nr:hypothetical protein [Nitrospirota bacterium]
MSEWLNTMGARMGLGSREKEPTILFVGKSLEAFEAITSVLEQLQDCGKRLGIILCAADPTTRHMLAGRYSKVNVAAPPFNMSLASALFLGRRRVRALVVLEDMVCLSTCLIDCVHKRATPVVLMSGRGMKAVTQRVHPLIQPELTMVVDSTSEGIKKSDAGVRLFSGEHDGFDRSAAEDVVKLLLPLVGQERKWGKRGDRKLGRWVGAKIYQLLENPKWRRRLDGRINRFDSIQDLSQRLGVPKTILCLGNGPSSEDPRLNEVNFDVLFRANHSWQSRGFLTEPDVIFTGNQATMRETQNVILGIPDPATEKVLLMFRGLISCARHLEYFVVDQLKDSLGSFDWAQHRPTSGAIMLASAVALQPAHLVIAGLDMFRHSEGSYPGDQTTMNAYTPAHSYDQELAFILFHLDRFQGKLTIMSEVLQHEWLQYCHQKERGYSSA